VEKWNRYIAQTASRAIKAGSLWTLGGVGFLVVTPAGAAADALLLDSLEYALRLPPTALPDPDLHALGSLRPTLIITRVDADPLPLAALLDLRKIALGVGAPLAVEIPADASPGLLQTLRDSGIAALLLRGGAAGQVAAVRDRLAALPERKPQRRGDQATPTLPAVSGDDEMDDDND